ncbi:MAG TPA: TIR domain-containing protein [Pyrinomonadaceae bacterium]|nr:TIR domain-containing protein [Pyrinomonadaceae bacterium]
MDPKSTESPDVLSQEVNSPNGDLDQALPEALVETTFQYDAFISYSTGGNYNQARKVEAFLESFHKALAPAGVSIKQMQICRDGSDFKLPLKRDATLAENDPVWNVIAGELSKARYLIVLCSPESRRSEWVSKEISWMVDHRGLDCILPAVTKGTDPAQSPDECFPAQLSAAGLHKARLWYDLRSWGNTPVAGKVRDAEDELVRLASDLLDWDAAQNGQLAPLWLREQLKRRRRQATLAIGVAAVLILAAALVIWRSVVASREASRARANAVVLAAEASSDPLTGALLLSELQGYDEPDEGTRVAQRLASAILPSTLVRGHTGRLTKVAFNPSQTRILTASGDGTARLWPVDGKGDPIILRGHTDGLTDAQFNSDGSMIATASKDKTARVWGEHRGDTSRVFEHESAVLSAQFSADKEWVATISETGLGQLWNIKGAEKRALSIPNNRKVVRLWFSASSLAGWVAASDVTVWSFQYDKQGNQAIKQVLRSAKEDDETFPEDLLDKVTFSPDGSHVAVVFADKVLVRRLENNVSVTLAHNDSVNSVDFNGDGTQLVSSCSDGKIRLWSTQTGEQKKILDVAVRYFSLDLSQDKPIREDTAIGASYARFSHNGLRIVSLFHDGIVRIWNVGYDGDTTELRGVQGADVVAFSKDDTQLVTGGDDGSARIWPLLPRTEPLILRYDKPVYSACLSADGRKVASGSSDGITRVWHISDLSNQVELKGSAGAIKGLAFDKSGTQLAVAQDTGTTTLWDLANSSGPILKRQFHAQENKLRGVQFSPDGLKVLAWSDSGNAFLWTTSGDSEIVLRAKHGSVWHAEFDRDGGRVVTAYDDGAVQVWNTDGSGSFISLAGKKGHTETVFRAVFSPDGSVVLTVSDDGTARLWKSDGSGDPIVIQGANPGKDGLENCAFSPDGRKFVITSSAGRAWAYNADGKGKPTVLRSTSDVAHIGSIIALAFSPDSERIVTGGGLDGIVRIWRTDGSGRPVTLYGHQGMITWANFSFDGSRIVTTSEDGTARIWRTSWRDLVSYLRTLSSASLTAEQRMIYLGESESDARASYEQEEKRFGRTPLPPNWQFSYPF